MTTSASADLELMRASLLLGSDPAGAVRGASEILARFPGHVEASLLLATACRNLGESATAVSVLEAVAGSNPGSPALLLELGRAYAAAGRGAEAIAAMKHAVTASPRFADGWRELAAQSFITGDTLAGDQAYGCYMALWLEPPELADAARALAENRLEAGEKILRRRLAQTPHDVAALRLLADAALRREDEPQATRILTECLSLAPGFAPARVDLVRLLFSQQRLPEMLAHVERLLATQPDNFDHLILKAQGLRLGRHREALELLERMVADHPDEEQVWVLYGAVLREIGEQARGIEAFRRALVARPGSPTAYASLANLKTFRFTEEDIAAMQEQLAREGPRGGDRIQLEFALGAALEQRGEFAESFEHYARGNTLQRATLVYDPEVMTEYVRSSSALFTPQFFDQRAGWGSEQVDPIFIIGMPRSGSTLLEQMLSTHSQIEGTRELSDIPALAFELVSRVTAPTSQTILEQIDALRPDEAAALAARYLERTREHRHLGRPRFIDKLPGNWSQLGFIQLLFPRAAIIDARRHPLGCGFSCYKQLFGRGQKFSYDLRELGLFSRDYMTFVQHFDVTLPGRVHRLNYEQLVTDPATELRRLLEYCGLAFEEDCLRFHENRRTVSTLSSEQVRQPLYAEGLDQWRNYEQWLGPLKGALGELVKQHPYGPTA